MEYYSTVKKNTFLRHTATEMNFKGTWLNLKKNSQQLTILLYHVYNILEITLNIIKMEN